MYFKMSDKGITNIEKNQSKYLEPTATTTAQATVVCTSISHFMYCSWSLTRSSTSDKSGSMELLTCAARSLGSLMADSGKKDGSVG